MHSSRTSLLPLVALVALLPLLSGCGDAGAKTADVVQAATREASAAGRKLATLAAELADTAPEEARTKLREVVDAAAEELREIRDSETARRVVAEVERALDALVALARKLGETLDLEGLKQSAAELYERFRSDPRVTGALDGLREKLDALSR